MRRCDDGIFSFFFVVLFNFNVHSDVQQAFIRCKKGCDSEQISFVDEKRSILVN